MERLGGPADGRPELVIGTYCRDTHNRHLFSTGGPNNTWLPPGTADTYIAGDHELATRAMLASAAVPYLVPPVRVMRNSAYLFQDGGVYSPSPLSSVRHWLFHVHAPLKMVYFVSSMELPIPRFALLDPLNRFISSTCGRDVADATEAFASRINATGRPLFKMSTHSITEAVSTYHEAREALLIIKPYQERCRYNFDLANFRPGAIGEVIRGFNAFGFEVYYAEKTRGQ